MSEQVVFSLPIPTSDFLPPRSTYFRTSDATPFIQDGTLHLCNGTSYRASWGSTNCRSTVSTLTPDVIKVQVTGWHKHTVSPVGGNFYFVNEAGEWVRRTANAKAVKAALG